MSWLHSTKISFGIVFSPVRVCPVIWCVSWPAQVQVLLQNLLAELRHMVLAILFLLPQLALPCQPPLLLIGPLRDHWDWEACAYSTGPHVEAVAWNYTRNWMMWLNYRTKSGFQVDSRWNWFGSWKGGLFGFVCKRKKVVKINMIFQQELLFLFVQSIKQKKNCNGGNIFKELKEPRRLCLIFSFLSYSFWTILAHS